MWWRWRKVRKANISDYQCTEFEQFGEGVLALGAGCGGSDGCSGVFPKGSGSEILSTKME